MYAQVKSALKKGEIATAKDLLEGGSFSKDHRYFFYLAFCHYKLNNLEESNNYISQSLAKNANFAASLLLWALVAKQQQNYQDRYFALTRLEEIKPTPEIVEALKVHHKRYLIVDENSPLLNTEGMTYKEFQSDYNQIRFYTFMLMQHMPDSFYDDRLFSQQVGEIIKNAIRHGNRGRLTKRVRVWFSLEPHLRIIVEDEGEGFQNLDEWNDFHHKRMNAIEAGDFEKAQDLMNFRHQDSQESDGGNSLIASLSYWQKGLLYNKKKNRVAVIRKMS